MCDILLRRAVILIEIGWIDVVSVRKVTAMSIARAQSETITELRHNARRQGVVPACGIRELHGNIAQLRILLSQRPCQIVINAQGLRRRLVDVRRVVVVQAANAQIADVDQQPPAQFTLHID